MFVTSCEIHMTDDLFAEKGYIICYKYAIDRINVEMAMGDKYMVYESEHKQTHKVERMKNDLFFSVFVDYIEAITYDVGQGWFFDIMVGRLYENRL